MAVDVPAAAGSVSGRRIAIRVLTTAMHLQALDDLWTSQLEALRAGQTEWSPRVAQELGELHREIVDELSRLSDPLAELGFMIEAVSPEEFMDAAETARDGSGLRLSEDPLTEMLTSGLEDFDLRGAVITGIQYVREESWQEISNLDAKARQIASGEIPDGDFRLSFKCALFLVGVGASVGATVATGGAPLIVGAALGGQACLAAHAWTSSGCATSAEEVAGRRR